MKKVLLAVDWSNIAFRSLYMAAGFGSGQKYTYDYQEEINSYIAKMASDISYLLRMFTPNKIVFCADSKHSWRKDVLETYKGNREKSSSYNWENIFKALDTFKAHLMELGYVFAEAPHAEADDMLGLIKDLVFNDPDFVDYNVILVSSDADIRQLIDFNKLNHKYCMVFNEIGKGKGGFRRLFCNIDIEKWYNQEKEASINDIFDMGIDFDKNYIKNVIAHNQKVKLEVTDPENILLSKIFCGDDGDNVPAFYDWYNNKGKKVRITNSKFVKILELMEAHNIEDIDENKDNLQEVIETVIKRKITDIDVIERLKRQKKLVELKPSLFPQEIQDYEMVLKGNILKQEQINFYEINMKSLIQGSEFEEVLKENRANYADICKNRNNYVDKTIQTLW